MITAENITKSYGSGEAANQVLKGISVTINDGDYVVILGASGSGKSTFLNVVSGLEKADSGSVKYDGKDITRLSDKQLTKFRKDNIGFIFQQYYLLPNMTVEKNVKMGADLAGRKDYREIIEAVGLGAYGKGLQQRKGAVGLLPHQAVNPNQRPAGSSLSSRRGPG